MSPTQVAAAVAQMGHMIEVAPRAPTLRAAAAHQSESPETVSVMMYTLTV